ncbi:MAG: hypothetical protein RR653_13220 [Clostridia bacterium]
MRGLKIGAIAAVALLLVMGLMVGYLFMTAEVQVIKISAQGLPAANQAEQFEKLKTSVTDETFIGTIFQKPLEWKPASDYVYLNYTLKIRNNCLVPIDMVEVQVVPQSTDILQLGQQQIITLNAKSEGDVNVSILAPKEAQPVREMIVTYYVWGVGFRITTTYGEV